MKDRKIYLFEMSDEIPPALVFSITINDDFCVECYKCGYSIPVRDIFGIRNF